MPSSAAACSTDMVSASGVSSMLWRVSPGTDGPSDDENSAFAGLSRGRAVCPVTVLLHSSRWPTISEGFGNVLTSPRVSWPGVPVFRAPLSIATSGGRRPSRSNRRLTSSPHCATPSSSTRPLARRPRLSGCTASVQRGSGGGVRSPREPPLPLESEVARRRLSQCVGSSYAAAVISSFPPLPPFEGTGSGPVVAGQAAF